MGLYVYGVIVESNVPSLALHHSLGFYKAAHFEHMGYKQGMWHGIIWMQKNIDSFDSDPAAPIPFAKYRT